MGKSRGHGGGGFQYHQRQSATAAVLRQRQAVHTPAGGLGLTAEQCHTLAEEFTGTAEQCVAFAEAVRAIEAAGGTAGASVAQMQRMSAALSGVARKMTRLLPAIEQAEAAIVGQKG